MAIKEYRKKIEKCRKRIERGLNPLISIAVDIAYHNPRVYPNICLILSIMIDMLPTDEEKIKVINRIINRFSRLPNTDYLMIWLQRMSFPFDFEYKYQNRLCDLVINSALFSIWNNEWIPPNKDLRKFIDNKNIVDYDSLWNNEWITNQKLRKIIDDKEQIINRENLINLSPIMQEEEINPFPYQY